MINAPNMFKNKNSQITWNESNDGYGTRKDANSTITVARPKTAIADAILYHCRTIALSPKKWHANQPISYSNSHGFGPLYNAEPDFSYGQRDKIVSRIEEIVPVALKKICSPLSDTMSDFVFLVSLGKNRNWRNECCVCLTDDMMGTTCGCGHFEIAIFRPCGHSVCINPCFYQLIEREKVKLQDEILSGPNGMTFRVPGKKDVTVARDFLCPMCRIQVKSVFRAEDTYFTDYADKFDINSMVEEIYQVV